MEHVLWLYQQPYDPKRPMVCFDEKSVQLLADKREPILMKPGHSKRQDYEYKRNGTRNLFVFVEPKAGQRQVLVTARRTKMHFAYLDFRQRENDREEFRHRKHLNNLYLGSESG